MPKAIISKISKTPCREREMAPQNQPFEIIREPETSSREPVVSLDQILQGVKAIPQKTVHALSNCFALLTVATVFWLALSVMKAPSEAQLTGLAGYGIFILIINWIVRK